MGCAPDVPLQRLQAVLGLLGERRPDLDVVVTHLPSGCQVDRLRTGLLDLGLLHESRSAADLEFEPVYRGDRLEAIVPLGHRVAARAAARLEDLAGDVLLVVPHRAEPGPHERVLAMAAIGGCFRAVREAPGAHVRDLLFAVAGGAGVAAAPRTILRLAGDLADAVAARVLEPTVRMPDTGLAWPAGGRVLGDVRAAARDVARELYGAC
jgi:hypothetical protein